MDEQEKFDRDRRARRTFIDGWQQNSTALSIFYFADG
jgi:hypothetical protein